MAETILFYIQYGIVTLFGVFLSFAFSGIRISGKKNFLKTFGFAVLCGILQIAGYLMFGEEMVWKIYPLIVHFPLVFIICVFYKKRAETAFAAVTSAYLCCQPANWVGLAVYSLTEKMVADSVSHIIVYIVIGVVAERYIAPYLSEIFQKETKSVLIFGSVPIIYYFFDYTMGIYTDFWTENNRVVEEFLPFFICIIFVVFSVVYYKEYEQKSEAERNEQLIRIVAEQQGKEVEKTKANENEIRILRHDMRHLLNNVAVCIDNGEKEQAKELISAYVQKIDRTKQKRYCENETLNCILSDFAAKCELFSVDFSYTVEPEEIATDELIFGSIVSNALDNALNAQKKLLGDERYIKLLIKTVDGRLLLSVKNPVKNPPVFVDGMPVAEKKGHGYGTRSIRYMAERLGGNSQFLAENGCFILRVII